MTATLEKPVDQCALPANADPIADFLAECEEHERGNRIRQVGIAYHEAGHAVASRVFGGRVIAMTIDPAEQISGACWSSSLVAGPTGIRQELIFVAAGDAALELYNFDLAMSIGGSTHDVKDMKQLAKKLHGEVAENRTIDNEIDLARKRAAVLVNRYWSDVETVAISLIRHHELVKEITPEFRVDLFDQ